MNNFSNIYIYVCFIIIQICEFGNSYSQNSDDKFTGYKIFYYSDGKKSSEGYLKDGNPDGYWKTYYPNGNIKSEGNRKNSLLDSTWKFYNDSGKIQTIINYKIDKKDGKKINYYEDKIVEENYIANAKQGITKVYYKDGKLKQTINFLNGKEDGVSREYLRDGTIITILNFKKGYQVSKEMINRRDSNNMKQGIWKTFYDNYNLKSEGVYKNNKKNGYFKDYSIDGNVENISKYIDDVIQIDAPEITTLELRTDYYSDGQKKVIGTYSKDGKPEGFRREYNKDGTIKSAKIFKSGVMIGKGIVDDGGIKNDSWKEYFETGELRGEGNYKNDRRIGKWIFYHRNGKIEQTGTYIEGEIPDGEWKWFYESGKLLKSEIFKRGLLEGQLKEYTDSGNVITEGKYQDDLKEGEWFYDMNDHKEIGSYKSGMRDGEWKHYYNNGNLSFTGNYIDGIPEGKHTWYHENGVIKEEGVYEGGRKEGEWKMYYKDGSVLITTYYKHGQIERIDGNKVNLPLVKEEE